MPAAKRNALSVRDRRTDRFFQACGNRLSPPNDQDFRENMVAGLRPFETDECFIENLAIGANHARAVVEDRQTQGPKPLDPERGWDNGPAGSNTTGSAAAKLDRRWMAFEKDRTYLAASAFRFVDELPTEELATLWSRLHSDNLPVQVNRQQRELVFMEKPRAYREKAKRRRMHNLLKAVSS